MKNSEPHTSAQLKESSWTDLPLFSQIVKTPSQKNAAPQISVLLPEENFSVEPSLETNVEPQKCSETFAANSSSLTAEVSVIENSKPEHQLNAAPDKKEEKENEVLHSFENAAPHKSKKAEKVKIGKAAKSPKAPKPIRRRKARPKSPEKKIRSQKRIAEPLKAFASPAERADVKSRAESIGCSLSNYIRLHIGLPLNEAGRKKRKTQAAFDLDESNLEQ